MGISDEILGTLANVLEISAALSAAIVFFTSRERTEKASKSIFAAAEWAVNSGWLVWLKRASAIAYGKFERLYGPRASAKRTNFFGYLTDRSLAVSFRLTAIYLIFGTPLLVFFSAASLEFWEKGPQRHDLAFYASYACLISAVAAAAFMELKRINKHSAGKDKFAEFIVALFFGCFFPALIVFLAPPFLKNIENGWLVFALSIMLFLLMLIFIYKCIKSLCFLFGIFVPIGLAVFLFASLFFFFNAFCFASAVGYFSGVAVFAETSEGEQYFTAIPFAIFIFACGFYLFSKEKKRRHYYALFASFALALVETFFVIYAGEKKYDIFTPSIDGDSLFSAYMINGAIITILASVVYANAICDWLSVGLTRYLTLATASARKRTSYAMLIAIDCFFAAALFMATMVIFVGLTKLYLMLSRIPADSFLSGLQIAITSDEALLTSELPLSQQKLGAFASIGLASGNYIRIFAFTAIIPTFFHLAVIVVFALIKAIGRIAYGPARAVLERKQEALSGGEHSMIAFHRIIYGGSIFFATSAVLMAGYSLTALFN